MKTIIRGIPYNSRKLIADGVMVMVMLTITPYTYGVMASISDLNPAIRDQLSVELLCSILQSSVVKEDIGF